QIQSPYREVIPHGSSLGFHRLKLRVYEHVYNPETRVSHLHHHRLYQSHLVVNTRKKKFLRTMRQSSEEETIYISIMSELDLIPWFNFQERNPFNSTIIIYITLIRRTRVFRLRI